MKASQVIQEYNNGKRDFPRLNLRGANFAGKDLSGANFSYCQIQGANFKQANLTGANFTGAKAGLQKRWVIILLLIAWVLFVFFSSFSLSIGGLIDPNTSNNKIDTWLSFIVLTIFFAITYQRNLRTGLVALATIFSAALAILSVLMLLVYVSVGTDEITTKMFVDSYGAVAATTISGVFVVVIAFAAGFAIAINEIIAMSIILTGILTVFVNIIEIGLITVAITLAIILFSCFISYLTLKNEMRDPWLRRIAIYCAAIGGTSFYKADLTAADFTGANLKNTNFNQAILTRSCFKNTVKLNLARAGNTILANSTIRDLLINPSNGYGIDLYKADLRGANLEVANLQEANLSQSDISEASFKYANLKDTNLTEVNAVKTNFSNATLTGACLENWNIDATTILENVDCQYVYLRNDKKERRPSSGEFQGNEFSKLFKKVFDTVDLIFKDGIDWKAFLSAMNKVQVQNEEISLEVQSIEKKEDGVFVVKVHVPPDADKEKLHEQLVQKYEQEKKELEAKYIKKLDNKDQKINHQQEIIDICRQQYSDMKKITETLAARQTQIIQQTHLGDGNNIGKDKTENNNL